MAKIVIEINLIFNNYSQKSLFNTLSPNNLTVKANF